MFRFFALEFLKSLVDSRLVKCSFREQQWIWDLDRIRSENITDNVLHLLSNKMASLPDNVQVAVKVLSCFGIKTDEAIVERLCLSTCYPDFRKSLDRAISERCIQKKGSDFKFIHDKVREAAYELLPHHERRQVCFDAVNDMHSALAKRQFSSNKSSVVSPSSSIIILGCSC